jgi:hydrogenase nickel incorporation protein HypA/HybF
MHEVGVVTELIELITIRVSERATAEKPPGSLRVCRVTLEIGKLTALLPDSIRFCFDLCCQGTLLEGATLEIAETSGDELKIKEVEVRSCAELVDADLSSSPARAR